MGKDPTFWVRDVPVYGDTMLAPMAGFSDVPHRAICRAHGAAMNYTEFVASEELLGGSKRAWKLLDFVPEDRPMVFQIFGNEPGKILSAALAIEKLGPDIIDVNMGCSTRRVSGRGAGVGMMKNPAVVAETFRLLTKQISVPVTAKIRLGWNDDQNFLDVGRILEDNGASLIAIHPRTKEQGYRGSANWEAIGELKKTVSLPVIGNGDVWRPGDVDRMLAETGCDAVMIGRGAIGNPWIFARRDKESLSFAEAARTVRKHLATMCDYYGEHGLVLFRKHLKRYFGGMAPLAPYNRRLVVAGETGEFLAILAEAEQEYGAFSLGELTSSR